jgi:hypothetical protein
MGYNKTINMRNKLFGVKTTILKKIVLGFLGALMVRAGKAQTFAEWFQQNSTRLKYYAEQVAALQAYLWQMQQGFKVSSSGLGSIGNLKVDEFGMHSAYYSSLTMVNPSVLSMPEVTEISALAAANLTRVESALIRYRRDGMLSTEQVSLIEDVLKAAMREELQGLKMLVSILTSDELQLTDDQRASRVLAIHSSMRDRYGFLISVTDRVDLMERQMSNALTEMGTVKGIYGIQ